MKGGLTPLGSTLSHRAHTPSQSDIWHISSLWSRLWLRALCGLASTLENMRARLPEGGGSAPETSRCRVPSRWRYLLPGYRPAWDSSPQVQGPPLFSSRHTERFVCHQRAVFSGITHHTVRDSLSETLRTSLANRKDGQNYLKGYTVSVFLTN